MNLGIIIPARYQSTRFPGKPLIMLGKKSMIQRVYEQCTKVLPKEQVWIASDDERIFTHCKENDIPFIATSSNCLTGTDRVYQAAQKIGLTLAINVQGDEPLISPDDIQKIINAAKMNPRAICNGHCPIRSEKDFFSTTIPKVVSSPNGELFYMSRAGIPGNKNKSFVWGYKQVCIYSFPIDILEKFYTYGKKTPLETQEDIEILRFLELGFSVKMIEVSESSIAIDTPEDQARVLAVLKEKGELN